MVSYIIAFLGCFFYWSFIKNYNEAKAELETTVGQHYHNKFIDIPNGIKTFPMYSVIIMSFSILPFKQALVWIAAMIIVNMVTNILADRIAVNHYRYRYVVELIRHSVSFWLTAMLFITILAGFVKF